MRKRSCVCLAFLLLFISVVMSDFSGDTVKIEALLEAILNAQRPSDSIHFEFQEEVTGASSMVKSGTVPPPHPPFEKSHYTVKMKGLRSRIEQNYQQFSDHEIKEASIEIKHTYAFDGTRQRRLTEPIKSDNILQGWQYLRNKNQNLINKKVYRSPVDFSAPDILSKYKCEFDYKENEEVYVLKMIKENGNYYQYTVAPNKGYSIFKIECYTSRGLDYEVNYSVKQYDNGVWYPSEVSKFRCYGSEKFLENKIKFTKIEFNADIPDEAFELKFPSGTKVWDGIMKDWFYVGGDPDIMMGSDIQFGGTELTSAAKSKDVSTSEVQDDVKKTSISDNEDNLLEPVADSFSSKITGSVLWLIVTFGIVVFAIIYFVWKRRVQ